MVWAEAQLVDSQGAPIKRFGFVWPVDGLEQLRQIIEVAGDSWMVRAEAVLVNGKSAPIKRLGFVQPIG
jgi:hypothetical protein